jgi:hypothetical protein
LGLLQPGPTHDACAAATRFAALAEHFPQDPLVALHHQRLRDGATDDVVIMAEK